MEDDQEVGETVAMAFSLRWPECDVRVQDTGAGALKALASESFDLAVLDVNLPDQDGFTVLESIRKGSRVPVIMLSVRASEAEKVRGLMMGADDYVAKPFSPFELVARASAVLRRVGGNGEGPKADAEVLLAGPFRINLATAEVFARDQPAKLSPTEFKILVLLVQNAGRLVTRDALLENIWGLQPGKGSAHLVKLQIQHLRRKLGDSGMHPKLIITVPGFGYKVPT